MGEPDAGADQYPLDHEHGADIPLPDGFAGDLKNCVIGPGPCVPFDFNTVTHCHWLPGSCFYLGDAPPLDMIMPLPPGFPPPKAPKPVPAPVSPPDMAIVHDMAQPAPVAAIPSLPALPAGLPALPNLQATVEHPQNAPALPAGPVSPLALAALAVGALTTGAAWKYWQNRSKLKHEERMKELENQPRPDEEQKEKCDSAAKSAAQGIARLDERMDEVVRKLTPAFEQIEALQKSVGRLEETAAKASRKAGEVEELDERLTVIERKIRLAQEPAEKKAPAKKSVKR